ncbi:MAG: ABC transporter ATP-binding protein [Myxococcota bacterium]
MIEVENLNFTYDGAKRATLRGLDFEIPEGRIFGFLGPSGSGKSTTQKILYGLLRTFEGTVRVLGRDIREWDAQIYEQIGICFELPNHYSSLTVRENLEYFATLYATDTHPVDTVLEWVDLTDASEQRVLTLSKGMKVRLNVARSILHKPRLLFLDEPTGGLDPVNARRIKDLVLRLRDEGATVFVTTHDMMVADELCDEVAFLTGGQIRALDAPEVLKKQYGKRSCVITTLVDGASTRHEFPLDHLGAQPAFRQLLDDDVRIETIHSQETTLDRIFIEVTGEELPA